jgi:hypothetical protein
MRTVWEYEAGWLRSVNVQVDAALGAKTRQIPRQGFTQCRDLRRPSSDPLLLYAPQPLQLRSAHVCGLNHLRSAQAGGIHQIYVYVKKICISGRREYK